MYKMDKDKKGNSIKRRRLTALKSERSSFNPLYKDISTNLLPMAGRFNTTDRNKRRDSTIIDQAGAQAHKILVSGMMAGMTSPARPWHRLQTTDPQLNDYAPVKKWLDDVSGILRDIFARSNFYRAQTTTYQEVTSFGTSASLILPNFDNVIHCHSMTTGQYWIAADNLGYVNTLYREWEMTVESIVAEFGLDNVSRSIKDLYNKGNYDDWITVVQAIEPRKDRDHTKRDNLNMPISSCTFEAGEGKEDVYLRESGFKEFPGRVARWDLSGGDVYATNCPGIEAFRAIEQLQHQSIDKGKAIKYMADPAIIVPNTMALGDYLPGGVSTYSGDGAQKVQNARDVRIDLNALLLDIQDVRQRIDTHFYADLFQMITRSTDRQRTATEIAERHEEKLLMLGPVLERLHHEDLAPSVERTFRYAFDAGILPPVPKEMEGADIKIEFISVLAQAQKAVGLSAMDQLLMTVGNVAKLKPDVIDKVNGDAWIDKASDILGVDPDLVVANDQVQLVRQERAEQQQAQQMADMLPSTAQAAKTLSETNTRDPNALTDMFSQV